MDGVADGLIVATEGVGNPHGALTARGGKEDLAAAQGEGIAGTESGGQCVAVAIGQGTDEDGCTHTGEDTTFLRSRLFMH